MRHMTFLTNWAGPIIVAAFFFFSLSSFGVALSEVPKTNPQAQVAKNSVWRIESPFGEGVGFFTDPGLFVTSFDTASLVLTGGDIRSIMLSQGNSTLKVRRLLALSAYGLALFETEPVKGSMNITENLPDPEEDLFIPTYSDSEFIKVKKKGNIFFSKSNLYYFSVGQSLSSLAKIAGSPVLNKQEDIVGVVITAGIHMMLTLKSSYLKEFIAGDEGLSCVGSESIKACIRKAMDSLKERAYAANDPLSQYLLALMYFRKKEQHWWVEWSQKPGHLGDGAFVFSGNKKIDYREKRSLAQRNNIKIGRPLPLIKEEAFELMSSAAEQGLPEALIYLVIEYLSEAEYLSEEDRNQSLRGIFHLVSSAAEQGFYLLQFQKALMLLQGVGTGKDVPKALVELNKAADQNFIPALEKLVSLYEGETGILIITKDLEKVVEYRTRAADLGSSESEYKLAEMYLMGDRGVERNPQKAKELLIRAANKGHTHAQYALGMMNHTGNNGEMIPNPLEAYKWISAAASKDFAPAQHMLSEIASMAALMCFYLAALICLYFSLVIFTF